MQSPHIRDGKSIDQTKGRYREILEAAPDAMVVVNNASEIVLLNVQAEKQFGYGRDELLGQQVKRIIPEGFAARLIADGLRSPADAMAQQIGTGIELIGKRKNGSEFPIEIMLSPLESVDGILITAAIRDITKRKVAEKHLAETEDGRRLFEEALRESEERYRLLLDGIEDYAIFAMDTQGGIVSWNVGAIEDSVAPIHDHEGETTGAVIVFRDISSSRAMALQMAYSAQHDFLTDLPNDARAIATAEKDLRPVFVV